MRTLASQLRRAGLLGQAHHWNRTGQRHQTAIVERRRLRGGEPMRTSTSDLTTGAAAVILPERRARLRGRPCVPTGPARRTAGRSTPLIKIKSPQISVYGCKGLPVGPKANRKRTAAVHHRKTPERKHLFAI